MISRSDDATTRPYVLGLDIGANSLGWAAIAIDEHGQPTGFLHPPDQMAPRPSIGVRVFDAGVENYGQGAKEEGRGQKRRTARLARRQIMRRARRAARTFRLLQENNLLPSGDPQAITERGREVVRDEIVKRLDEELSHELAGRNPDRASEYLEALPYALRVDALDRALTRHELGRALFHLSQRRGFKSNRKEGRKAEPTGPVHKGISEIEKALQAEGSRTLGEHLLRLRRSGRRIRSRWTARSMYEAEFDSIWDAQCAHHPDVLTDKARKRIRNAIFHQRALRSQRSSIGGCELECGDEFVSPETGAVTRTSRRRRAPECLLVSQRFRLLQKVNDLAIDPGHGRTRVPLTDDQRNRLARELETAPKLSFGEIRRRLGLSRDTKFNLETGGTKELLGNQTNARLSEIFGDRWKGLTSDQRDLVVLELWSAPNEETVVRRAKGRLGIWAALLATKDEADRVARMPLSGEYMALSKRAMRALLEPMERGVPYTTAIRQVYGERVRHEKLDMLPPVAESLGALRNPTVMRALTEARRVVNHLLAAYGRPEEIRVELARDLKRSKDERNRIERANRKAEEERIAIAERIVEESGIADPRPRDILRVRLANECGWQCPYTGQSFGMAQLLGKDIDVEHIIPYSTCLDDSYGNKTLCFANVNRTEKGNRHPHSAFGHDAPRWQGMVSRMEANVEKHKMSARKLERFALEGEQLQAAIEGFTSSQLNDTRYASRAAKEYLAILYGGNLSQGVDADGRKRILVGNGQATSLVRRQLGLEGILRHVTGWPGGTGRDWDKRADHRHHAMDAITIALTGTRMLQQLARAADAGIDGRQRVVWSIESPWATFESDATCCLDNVVISFRIDNRSRGALHAETIYSPPRRADGVVDTANGKLSHVRKPVSRLTPSDLEDIVDPRVRRVVTEFFGGREPGKVCREGDLTSFPHLEAADGRKIPVLRVRLRKNNTLLAMGKGPRTRHVENDANHHLVVRKLAPAGDGVAFRLVPMHEAVRRRAHKEPIVQRDHATLMTVARNDVVELLVEDRARLCRIQRTSEKEFEGCWITDARPFDVRRRTGGRVRTSPRQFSERRCRKMAVSPIGVLRPCRA